MASGTPPTNKRNSLQRLSHIFQLASPSFVRLSLDGNSAAERRKVPRPNGSPLASTSPTQGEPLDRGYNPTASILSTTESNLSSPLSPLLPVTPRTPSSLADEFPLPPTLNELAASEKAMLMRKMKKLSKVLGEVPVPQVVDEEAAVTCHRLSAVVEEQRSSITAPSRKPFASDSAKRAFRRSFTVGYTGHHAKAVSEVHRVRSLSSLRPSLAIPAPSRHSAESTCSPITFAWPDGEKRGNVTTPSTPSSPHAEPVADDSDAQSVTHKSSKRRDSTASSILLADQNPEQVQRTRAAKLSRYLGENVPPEILRRAASPPPRSVSPPTSPHIVVDEAAPNPSVSKPLIKSNKRPLSLDARALKDANRMSAGFSPSAPSSPTFQEFGRTDTLRRSRSMWAKRGEDEAVEDVRQESPEGSSRLSTEKQRALNVRRARKLTQLFGDNPPTALFQITNLNVGSAVNLNVDDSSTATSNAVDGRDPKRDSLATIISISTTSISPGLSGTNRKVRDSYISIITTSSEMSALVLAERDGADDIEKTHDEKKRHSLPASDESSQHREDDPDKASFPSSPSEPDLTSAVASPVRISTSAVRQGAPRLLSLPSNAVIHQPPRTPPTPPPFADYPTTVVVRSPSEPGAGSADPSSPQFQTRRRRAAKLSKFFGVEVGELAEVLPPEVSAPAVPAKAVVARELPVMAEPPRNGRRQSTTVAEARNRRRFLGLNEGNDVKEVEVTDVLDQLRRMKNR